MNPEKTVVREGRGEKRARSSSTSHQSNKPQIKKVNREINSSQICDVNITDLDKFLCEKYNTDIDNYIKHHLANYKSNLHNLCVYLGSVKCTNNFIIKFGWNSDGDGASKPLKEYILNIYKDAYLTLRDNRLQGYSKKESLTESSEEKAYYEKLASIMYSTYSCFNKKRAPITLYSVINQLVSSGLFLQENKSKQSKLANTHTKALLKKINEEVEPLSINEQTTFNCILPNKTTKECFNKYMTDTFAWYSFNNATVQERIHKYIIDSVNHACFLRPIYKLFMLYDFINGPSSEDQEDELDDVEIEVKKYNSKIKINVPNPGDSTPYASMKITGGDKPEEYKKCYFSINNTHEPEPNIHFNTPPTNLIEPNSNIYPNDREIKICSYNLNWAGQKSKMISNHLNNILLSDIILLQELNINNSEIVIGTSDTMKTTDNKYVPLTFSKDVYNILQKQRMKYVIGTYYKNSSDSNNTFVVPLYKSALETKYNIIYFPNRVSKSKDIVKLNAIMYDSSKITITDVFVGLLDSNKYLKHRHFCLCCKYKETSSNSEICVINIHLDTDYNKKIQLSEIKYLFSLLENFLLKKI